MISIDLYNAAFDGDLEKVKALLDKGTDLNAKVSNRHGTDTVGERKLEV